MGEQRLNRAQPGDSPADTWTSQAFNVFADSADEAARLRRQFLAGVPQGRNLQMGLATVRNDTGADLARFAVVGLGAPIIDNADSLGDFKSRVAFKGLTPDIDIHKGKFAILIEPLADGKIGKALVSGVCQVLLTVGDAADKWAEIADGETAGLTTGAAGAAQILWKETGTGSGKWAIVRLGPPAPDFATAWAKVQSGHTNFGLGVPARTASVKLLDEDGDEYGDAFNVYLPWPAGKHPALFAGDAIVICTTVAGVPDGGYDEPACLTDCSDDALGTIKAFAGAVGDIPDGWALCDGTSGTVDLTGRFIMGVDPDGLSDEKDIGDTGGYRKHGSSENNHTTHAAHPDPAHSVSPITDDFTPDGTPALVNAGVSHIAADWSHDAHADSDNRPRYYVLAYMQRVE